MLVAHFKGRSADLGDIQGVSAGRRLHKRLSAQEENSVCGVINSLSLVRGGITAGPLCSRSFYSNLNAI